MLAFTEQTHGPEMQGIGGDPAPRARPCPAAPSGSHLSQNWNPYDSLPACQVFPEPRVLLLPARASVASHGTGRYPSPRWNRVSPSPIATAVVLVGGAIAERKPVPTLRVTSSDVEDVVSSFVVAPDDC